MNLILRKPEREDYEQVASWVCTLEECRRWAGPKMPYPFATAELWSLIADASPVVVGEIRQCFVICSAPGTVVGYGELVREDEETFRLARLIVAPASRRGGVAGELCRRLISKAQTSPGARRVRLNVYRDNAPAIGLYARLGFTEEHAEARTEIMVMEKRLP